MVGVGTTTVDSLWSVPCGSARCRSRSQVGCSGSAKPQSTVRGAAMDPMTGMTFGIAALVLLSTRLLGRLVPVIRASRVDPIRVLPAE
jgi:hypothetical protein